MAAPGAAATRKGTLLTPPLPPPRQWAPPPQHLHLIMNAPSKTFLDATCPFRGGRRRWDRPTPSLPRNGRPTQLFLFGEDGRILTRISGGGSTTTTYSTDATTKQQQKHHRSLLMLAALWSDEARSYTTGVGFVFGG